MAPRPRAAAGTVERDDPPHPDPRGTGHPEPRKRPGSSYVRFEAAQPNETWQSDFTHWRLHDGTDVEILNWLDDHSRLLLSCTAHAPVTGDDVVTTFLAATERHGIPASTLTDNGRLYTARYGGGRNAFEHLLPVLGVKQKNGSPGHPQTQGKIQLDRFRTQYNEHRPTEPSTAPPPPRPTGPPPKALPAESRLPDRYRLRYDRIGTDGHVSIRRAGRMHHLGIGRRHTGKRILAITDETTATVIHLDTGEILSEHHLDPTRGYWRNQLQPPGRWPHK